MINFGNIPFILGKQILKNTYKYFQNFLHINHSVDFFIGRYATLSSYLFEKSQKTNDKFWVQITIFDAARYDSTLGNFQLHLIKIVDSSHGTRVGRESS